MIGRSVVLLLCLFNSLTFGLDTKPRVIAVWPNGPLELRVAFDRPVPAETVSKFVGERIVFGEDVVLGERYIERKPGDQPSNLVRGSLRITAAKLVDGGRTLVFATDPHSRDAIYTLSTSGPIPISLIYDLKGVELSWAKGEPNTKPSWTGWWPSLNDKLGRERLNGSAEIEMFDRLAGQSGRLTLKTLLPLPKGTASIKVVASGPLEVSLGNESAKSKAVGAEHICVVSSDVEFDVLDLVVTLTHDGKQEIKILATDGSGKPLSPSKQTLSWAPPLPPKPVVVAVPAELISGGDQAKGALVFKSEQAKCATCHKVSGVGGEIGPDLSDLVHRDRAWIYRNIAEPSGTIHSDYLTYTVLIKDGRVLNGIVRAEASETIKIMDTEGKTTLVQKAEIEELKPGSASIMPVGLIGTVGEANMKDLLAFLTTKVKP